MEELIRRTVGPQITLEVVTAGGLWPALIDPSQLESALLNLCINARDAMPEGGRITIETANKWLDDRAAKERDLPPGQYLSLCVTDTGTGMTPDSDRPRVRSVLHHQAARPGHRPRAVDGLWLRAAVRRTGAHLFGSGERHHDVPLPAAPLWQFGRDRARARRPPRPRANAPARRSWSSTTSRASACW